MKFGLQTQNTAIFMPDHISLVQKKLEYTVTGKMYFHASKDLDNDKLNYSFLLLVIVNSLKLEKKKNVFIIYFIESSAAKIYCQYYSYFGEILTTS